MRQSRLLWLCQRSAPLVSWARFRQCKFVHWGGRPLLEASDVLTSLAERLPASLPNTRSIQKPRVQSDFACKVVPGKKCEVGTGGDLNGRDDAYSVDTFGTT